METWQLLGLLSELVSSTSYKIIYIDDFVKKYKSKLNKFIMDMGLGSVSFGETESESK